MQLCWDAVPSAPNIWAFDASSSQGVPFFKKKATTTKNPLPQTTLKSGKKLLVATLISLV